MPTISDVDYMGEVNDLIMYVTDLPQSRVLRGNQSREVLPKTNDYCIYTAILRGRIGTNVATFSADDVPDDKNGTETDTTLTRIDIQIDFYGEKSPVYAQALETFARSYRCNQRLWQEKSPIRVLYASDPLDATLVDDTRQFVTRWTLTLSICAEFAVADSIPWIEDVNVIPNPHADGGGGEGKDGVKLINVDVNYRE